MRISVIGYDGSGKSALSRQLGAIYGLPVLHLDGLHFRKSRQERSLREEMLVLNACLKSDSWVIDGNYPNLLYQERMELADWIILLQFPRLTCLRQARKQSLSQEGATRNQTVPGFPKKFGWSTVRRILWESRNASVRKLHRTILETWPQKVLLCKNHHDLEALLRRDLRIPG